MRTMRSRNSMHSDFCTVHTPLHRSGIASIEGRAENGCSLLDVHNRDISFICKTKFSALWTPIEIVTWQSIGDYRPILGITVADTQRTGISSAGSTRHQGLIDR